MHPPRLRLSSTSHCHVCKQRQGYLHGAISRPVAVLLGSQWLRQHELCEQGLCQQGTSNQGALLPLCIQGLVGKGSRQAGHVPPKGKHREAALPFT